ncbi:ribonuclease H-like domain-containing protein [Tanacetum coccineum]
MEPATACASMAALVAASLVVMYSAYWIRLKTMHKLDDLSAMWADVIFGVSSRPANNTIWYRSYLHKFTLCLWQFWRLRVGDRRSFMGFNLEMSSKYANGSEYTNVSRCADIRFKDMFVVCHDDVDMPANLHQRQLLLIVAPYESPTYTCPMRISKLDISDLLHLHPNDTTALTVGLIKLKGTGNYQVWSCAMLLDLEGKNKIGFIDRSCKRSNTYEVLGKQWDRVNAIVLGWILNSISEELFLGQIFSKRAKHVWEELKETYDKVDGSIMFGLLNQINTLKQNGYSIADYYHKLNVLWKHYDAMIELPKYICNASEGFKKHNQLLKLMQFLMGLDDSYMQIRSSILSKETLSDVRSAYATIFSEESHRVVVGSITGSSQKNHASAFVSNVPYSQNFQRNNQNFNAGPSRPNNVNNNRQGEGSGLNNNRPSGGSSLVCENCGFNGHTIDRCFKIIGYPADFGKKKSGQNVKKQGVSNNNSVGKSSSSGFTDEQMATLISLIKDNKVGKNVQANMIEANQHMTYTDKELDNVIDISHLKIKVGHPNGTEAYISKIGNLRLSNGLTLYDVMVIPEYCVTLVSVHKLVKENKVIVTFDENKCYFLNQDLNLKNVLGIGEQCEGLYYYSDKGIKSNSSTLQFQCMLSQHDWHYKLGHPVDHVLNVLKDSLNFDKNDNTGYCEICQRAKQTREPFPLSDHKFFLTVMDDYTRAVWVYLIKSKDEVSHFITVFYNLIEIPFKRKIKVFRSDNGTEFVNQSVSKLCSDKEIIHQTSCVYTPQQNRIAERKHRHLLNVARDVKFFENIFPFKDSEVGKNNSTNVLQDVNHINFFDIEYPKIPNDDERVANDLNKGKSDSSSSSESGNNINTADFPVDSGNDADSSNDFVVTQDEEVATLEENVKYGLEKYVGYSKLNSKKICFISQLNKTREPKTYFEASKYSHWIDAMNQEMNALLRNGTWELVELPEGRKAIGSKWIYKIKFRSSGEIDRYKARLVAQGFGQKEGIDYEETFSPVVKMVTVRCLLNIVVSMSWPVFQLDVNNAFLYGDLEEVVYMKPPEGYFPSDNKVCRLKKSLYGLKQAPRQWNAKLTSTLIENGFSQSKSDYSLYTKSDKGVFLALLVYVDDIIITGNSVSEIEKFKVFLKSKFMIKDLGKLKYFLGIEVVDTDKGICLNQRKYVLDLLSEYGMLACKPAKTPLMSKLVISNEASDKDPLLENITDYQKLMGKLIYLTNTTPDISYVILRYLKSCPGLGVHITKTYGMFLIAFSDADWAKCVVTRKSVAGYCVFLNNSFIYWKSKKQNTLSKSSTEAEYRAVASVTSEVIWILFFLKDLQIESLLPVSLHCDINSAIKIAVNPLFHERTKHFEIDLYFVREKVLKEIVKTVKVDSANQIADIITKGFDIVQHLKLVKKLGMCDVYQVETKGDIEISSLNRWTVDERLRIVAAKFEKIYVGLVKLLYKRG